MKKQVEKIKITGLKLEDVFKEDFLDKLNEKGETFPVHIVFARETEIDKEKVVDQIQLSRRNSIEKKENILHLESDNEDFMNEIIDLLK